MLTAKQIGIYPMFLRNFSVQIGALLLMLLVALIVAAGSVSAQAQTQGGERVVEQQGPKLPPPLYYCSTHTLKCEVLVPQVSPAQQPELNRRDDRTPAQQATYANSRAKALQQKR